MYELARDLQVSTQSRSDQQFDDIVLTDSEFASIGPAIQDIVVHAEGQNFTGAFRYKISLQSRYRNGPWSSTDLLPNSTSEQYQISTPFDNRQAFGVETRIVLRLSVDTAGSGNVAESGVLNITAAVRFFN